jgi:choline dehydrogenase-like flavoprotein
MADFDAIVVGSGMSGGWSAKELAERGLKVLVLERGKDVDPEKDYSDTLAPWQTPNFNRINEDEIKQHYYRQANIASYAVHDSNKHFWVKDDEHPYETPDGKPYDWARGYHLGGRSLLWSRRAFRLGPQDFEANKLDGHGVDWPVRYEDIAPWYDHVERFAGISGSMDNLPQLPDGVFQPAFKLTCAENELKRQVENKFPGRNVIPARIAHLTEPTQEQLDLGRSRCQSRRQCEKGCIFGAYFSANSATLPAAMRTGNCTIVTDAIVDTLQYDSETGRVSGVNVIDRVTAEKRTYTARVVFLNASAIASAAILLNSTSEHFPNGLANGSDQVGRNLMDHAGGAGASGILDKFLDRGTYGRSPSGIYIPRYANITENDKPYLRGFGFQGSGRRMGNFNGNKPGIGNALKEANRQPRPWRIGIGAFGEILPYADNRITLHATHKDKWGVPIPVIDCEMKENEKIMMREAGKDAHAMLEAAGCRDISSTKDAPLNMSTPGDRIHEMGTVRMGRDPATSVLNGWCQAHDVANLFVTDGGFMTSSACQNPSLGYMAFSARAANYAADMIEQGVL